MDEIIIEYWREYYATDCCTICGNHGVIDSRGVRTAAGVAVGRLNYCICPNGVTMRNQQADLTAVVGTPPPLVVNPRPMTEEERARLDAAFKAWETGSTHWVMCSCMGQRTGVHDSHCPAKARMEQLPCGFCGQFLSAAPTGEYPCPACGVPRLHDRMAE